MTLPPQLRAFVERALAWYTVHSERDRRVILGVLIAAGLSLAYIGVVEPILGYRKGLAQDIADGQEQLERAMRFLAARDSLHAEREDLQKRLAQAKTRLLPGGTGTLGAAALQERANALAAEKGITVQSTQVMKEEAAEPFRKVAVRETVSGELKPLADFVSGLEYGQQLVIPFIEVSRRGAVAGAKGPRTLSATIEVSGFVQGDARAKARRRRAARARLRLRGRPASRPRKRLPVRVRNRSASHRRPRPSRPRAPWSRRRPCPRLGPFRRRLRTPWRRRYAGSHRRPHRRSSSRRRSSRCRLR